VLAGKKDQVTYIFAKVRLKKTIATRNQTCSESMENNVIISPRWNLKAWSVGAAPSESEVSERHFFVMHGSLSFCLLVVTFQKEMSHGNIKIRSR
jgi:hypothetical protein